MREPETRLAPLGVLRTMSRELDRLFDEAGWPLLGRRAFVTDTSLYAPHLDVFEKDEQLVARMDLPGMKLEDVTVELIEDRLVISGQRKRETEEQHGDWYRSEREFGSFSRTIPVPPGVMAGDIKATFSAGVLEVIVPVPKTITAPKQTIKIKGVEEPVKVHA
jgi:HSP20 family protein